MLRLTRKSKSKISNQLAIIAALILITSAVAGVDNHNDSTRIGDQSLTSAAMDQSALVSQQSNNRTPARSNKGFKTSLFLFRRG